MRTHAMRTHATSIAASAVLLLALAGCQAAPATAPSTAAASSASASDSAAAAGAARYPSWYAVDAGSGGAGILAAGSHATTSFAPGFTYTVPAGWVNDADSRGFFSLFQDTPANAAEFAASGGFANGIHMGPMDDPYFICQALESNRGTTSTEIVKALEANDVLATKAADVTIGGLTGSQVDVQAGPGFTSCPGDPPTVDLEDARVRGLLLDTADRGVLVIFLSSTHAADHEAFLADAMPILESFAFSTGQ